MARDRKLKAALAQYRGVDASKEKQKRLQKEANRRKKTRAKGTQPGPYFMSGALKPEPEPETAALPAVRAANGDNADEEHIWETDEDEEEEEGEDKSSMQIGIARILESESSSDDEGSADGLATASGVNGHTKLSMSGADASIGPVENGDGEDDDEEDEDEEDIPLSDIASIASEEKGDIIPHQRLTINNVSALLAAHKRIALPISKWQFSAHQSVTTDEPVAIADINDDLQREKEFLKQSLHAVREARRLLKAENVPFARPPDFFAEMVKSDEHMGRVRQKLVDAAAGKQAAQEARKQRDLKKFGKQVQIAKLQERSKERRQTLDKINLLKRKRANAPLTTENEPELFDIGLDDESSSRTRPDGAPLDSRKRQKTGGANQKRSGKNAKYGFGGKKRHGKSGDAFSSADMSSHPGRAMKGKGPAKKGSVRLGKSKRTKARQ